MPNLVEMVGKVFGDLTVLRKDAIRRNGRTTWVCQCACGKEHTVEGYDLRSGNTKSCGHPVVCCKYGHEMTQENTRIARRYDGTDSRDRRVCRICNASHQRGSQLKRKGWTKYLFDKTIKEQNGKCVVCQVELTFDGGRHSACADHQHVIPPTPRGVLCSNCNVGIGMLQDSPEVLKAAIAYLEKFSLETPAEEVKHLTVSA